MTGFRFTPLKIARGSKVWESPRGSDDPSAAGL